VSDVAVTRRLSGVVPSPQLTVNAVTVVALETVKLIVINWPVLAGLGVTLLIVTIGAEGGFTVSGIAAVPVDPLLSVAVTVIVKELAVA
jgi:hypothetical protein